MTDEKKVILAYLYTKFDTIESLENFINFYKKNPPDYNHDLLICYKLLNNEEINILRKTTITINHIEFIDPNTLNDYDFGSYKRIAETYPNSPIFFNLGHAYPVSKMWLKKIMSHFNKKTLIGSSASYESIFSSVKIKKKFKFLFNLKNYFFLKKNFKEFPNPHIRTINFILYGRDYLNFITDKSFFNKKDAWMSESGFDGMTNFFKNQKFNILIVNSDNEAFSLENCKFSETYCFKNQSKKLFSDKHSRKYDDASDINKLRISKNVWG
jgi:hypothetical protein